MITFFFEYMKQVECLKRQRDSALELVAMYKSIILSAGPIAKLIFR